jgi:hypothetical protein
LDVKSEYRSSLAGDPPKEKGKNLLTADLRGFRPSEKAKGIP